jgi:very-short-patch-repair endonuclease
MIDSFILDFYCSKLLLGIEIDGSSHDDKEEYDRQREMRLQDIGIELVRYRNDEIFDNLDSVYINLLQRIEERGKEIKYKQIRKPPKPI